MTALCTQLLHSNEKEEEKEEKEKEKEKEKEDPPLLSTTALQWHHKRTHEKGIGRCEWGKRYPPGCPRKRAAKRKFGTDMTESTVNGVSTALLGGSRTHSKCSKCHVWLCVEGPCWQRYHHSIGVNY
jgi:hypothetical protein